MRGDALKRLERGLGEEGAEGARILPLPALQLEEERGGQDELDPGIDLAAEDDAAGQERLEPGRQRGNVERAARLGDTVEQLAARGGEARGVAHVRDADERARGLGGVVDALARVDTDAHSPDERMELGLREGAEDHVETTGEGVVVTAARRLGRAAAGNGRHRDPLPRCGRSESVVGHAHFPSALPTRGSKLCRLAQGEPQPSTGPRRDPRETAVRTWAFRCHRASGEQAASRRQADGEQAGSRRGAGGERAGSRPATGGAGRAHRAPRRASTAPRT